MDPAPSDPTRLEDRYLRKRRQEIEASHTTATLLGLIVFPAFSILDFLTQRPYLRELLLVRLVATVIFAVAHLLARRGIRPGGVTVTAVTLLLLSSAGITALCLVSGGLASPYYAGINLLILTCVSFPPGNLRQTIAACGGIILIYAVGIVIFQPGWDRYVPMLINNLFFEFMTCAIGITTALFHEQLRHESFTRLVAAEDADAVRKAHAEVSKALGIRDEFISIASHELLTPITSMRLQNDLAKRALGKNGTDPLTNPKLLPQLRQWVGGNDKYISRLMRLIEDMLDVSRVNTGLLKLERSPTDLGACVVEVAERFRAQFEKAGIDARFEVEPEIHGVWDRFRLEQVVANLFSNAVKYASGSRLDVTVGMRDSEAMIRVADHGCGIQAADADKIFERFERANTPPGSSGLGLGLYISKKIVEGHGGRIWVEETPGGGCTFVVTLPRAVSPGLRLGPSEESRAQDQSGVRP